MSSKSSLPSSEAFSVFLYILQATHQLSGVRLLFNKFPWFETSHCIAYLYHAQDTWLCACLIILVTCWSQKIDFSPCFSKAKMPFLIFLCDTVFSLYGLPSKSESLWIAEAFPLACPWKTASRDSAMAFNGTSKQHHHMILPAHCKVIKKMYFLLRKGFSNCRKPRSITKPPVLGQCPLNGLCYSPS